MAEGKFVWYELATSDAAAAQAFYSSVVGWGMQDAGTPGMAYTLLTVGETAVGGMMAMGGQPGAKPGWMGYVGVADVDAKAAELKRAGGTVLREPDDIPGVGRFAVVADPQGASFLLFKGNQDQAMPALPPGTPGCIAWHELSTSDWQAGFDFYARLFGWSKLEAIDMGAMGIYQLFADGNMPIGGMMTMPAKPPSWLFYFAVDGIDAAVGRVTAADGQIVQGPREVSGGSWIVVGIDPQGAVFALVSRQR